MVIDQCVEIVVRWGTLILYIWNENVPCEKVNLQILEDIECIALVINLRVR